MQSLKLLLEILKLLPNFKVVLGVIETLPTVLKELEDVLRSLEFSLDAVKDNSDLDVSVMRQHLDRAILALDSLRRMAEEVV